jgi:hypothetical protein
MSVRTRDIRELLRREKETKEQNRNVFTIPERELLEKRSEPAPVPVKVEQKAQEEQKIFEKLIELVKTRGVRDPEVQKLVTELSAKGIPIPEPIRVLIKSKQEGEKTVPITPITPEKGREIITIPERDLLRQTPEPLREVPSPAPVPREIPGGKPQPVPITPEKNGRNVFTIPERELLEKQRETQKRPISI